MDLCTFIHEVPKCLDDGIYTRDREFTIKISGGRVLSCFFSYCDKCESYITQEGMEKDVKKVALEFIQGGDSFKVIKKEDSLQVQNINSSYELSDIVEVKEILKSEA